MEEAQTEAAKAIHAFFIYLLIPFASDLFCEILNF